MKTITLFKNVLIGLTLGASLINVSAVASDSDKDNSDKEIEVVAKIRDKALSSNLPYEILESLTTEVGARMAGTPQDALAVKWGVEKFKALGFDKVWTEPVTFDTWTRGQESAYVTAPYVHELKITALGFSIGTPKDGIEAEVIHFKTIEDLMQSKPDSAKGKIVFISHKMKKHIKGFHYGAAVKARSIGAVEAAKKGAVGVIIRSIGTDSHRLPHTGMMRYQKGINKIPAAAMSNPDADLMMRIFSRNKPVKIKMTMDAIVGKKYTSHNVIGEMTGTEFPNEKVIIGGHLDSWDLGTGAVDDGAGVAITMAAAKFIGDSTVRPKRTVRVVLFANEEQGLVGARAYAAKHAKDLENHLTGAESDFGAGKIYEFSSNISDDNLSVVKKMQTLMAPLGISYVGNNASPGPDLIPMYQLGMSVFRLQQDGTDYFDLHHTADDTLDKVVPENLSQNAAAYAVFAYIAANSEHKITRPKKQ